MSNKKEASAGKILGGGIKVLLAGAVLLFLGLHSFNFFAYGFASDKFYYAILGFSLTGIGAIGYLFIFMKDADTRLKKVISLAMVVICFLGEVFTAGFGMMVESWNKAGFVMTESDLNMMILFVGVLGFAHALALIGYFAGDQITELFADEDGDGIPNIIDADYRRPLLAAETDAVKIDERPNAPRQ